MRSFRHGDDVLFEGKRCKVEGTPGDFGGRLMVRVRFLDGELQGAMTHALGEQLVRAAFKVDAARCGDEAS